MHFMKHSVCHFLLVINSNLGRIFYRFRDMASFPLKTHIYPTPQHSTPKLKMFPSRYIAEILGYKPKFNAHG